MTENDTNTKTPRNTKSWKTEAGTLRNLLVQACGELTAERFEDNDRPDIKNVQLVANWWELYCDAAQSRKTQLKESALAKLSDDEKTALNL